MHDAFDIFCSALTLHFPFQRETGQGDTLEVRLFSTLGVCSLYVHYMSTTYLLYVHCIFTTRSLYVHKFSRVLSISNA